MSKLLASGIENLAEKLAAVEAENKQMQTVLDSFGIEILEDGSAMFKPSKMKKIWKYFGDKVALENEKRLAELEKLKGV